MLFFEHKRLYTLEGEVDGAAGRLGEAAVVREGRDVTLVTAMKGVHDGLEAAAELEADGVSVEVVDLRTLRPFDLDTVLASVRKTNRIVVVEEGPMTGGWAGEVLASVVEHGLGHLDDAWRIATPDTPIPYSPPLEDAFLPGAGRIAQEIRARVVAACARRRRYATDERAGAFLQLVERGLDGSKVGHRLRAERERLGIGLRELARRVGVSPSLVSQIELDRVNPSVSTLYAIVTELGMTMSDVFGERPEERVVQRGDGLAERPETRPVINLASGVRWERLTHERDPDVEFLYVVYPVGAASCPEDALMTHGGREYGYVTSGTLGVQVGFEVYELGPGGSIAFDSSSPHRLWAVGGEPVHAIWVVIGREADPRTTLVSPPRPATD